MLLEASRARLCPRPPFGEALKTVVQRVGVVAAEWYDVALPNQQGQDLLERDATA